MAALLVGLLVVMPLVELYVLIQVGQVIGGLPTVLLLLAMSVLGSVLLKREGTRTWRAFRSATSRGRVPAREVADGSLVIFGGALLLTPGFVTDVVGLLCVLPGSRAVLRRALTAAVARRLGVVGVAGTVAGGMAGGMAGRYGARTRGRGGSSRMSDPGPAGRVVDGEVVDDDGPPSAGS